MSADILEPLADRYNVKEGQRGVTLKKLELEELLIMVVAQIQTSAAHRYRQEKLQRYLDNVVRQSSDDETFYVHRSD